MRLLKLQLTILGTMGLLIGLSTLIFSIILLMLGGTYNIWFIIILVGIFHFIQWIYGPKMVEKMYKVKELKKTLPRESIVYFGDTARLPYGVKSKNLVRQYSMQITKFLIQNDAKIIIIACNTATAMALKTLRNKFSDIPIIGVIEPGVEQAILKTNNKNIGVIGTIATISSDAYKKSIKKIQNTTL